MPHHNKTSQPREDATAFIQVEDSFSYDLLEAELRQEVLSEAKTIRGLLKLTCERVIEIGKKLSKLKQKLGKLFQAWVQYEFDWSLQTARRFIQAAKFTDVNPKIAEFVLDVSALYLLSQKSCPPAAVAEALQEAAKGKEITHALAKEIVSKHKPPAPSRHPTRSPVKEVGELEDFWAGAPVPIPATIPSENAPSSVVPLALENEEEELKAPDTASASIAPTRTSQPILPMELIQAVAKAARLNGMSAVDWLENLIRQALEKMGLLHSEPEQNPDTASTPSNNPPESPILTSTPPTESVASDNSASSPQDALDMQPEALPLSECDRIPQELDTATPSRTPSGVKKSKRAAKSDTPPQQLQPVRAATPNPESEPEVAVPAAESIYQAVSLRDLVLGDSIIVVASDGKTQVADSVLDVINGNIKTRWFGVVKPADVKEGGWTILKAFPATPPKSQKSDSEIAASDAATAPELEKSDSEIAASDATSTPRLENSASDYSKEVLAEMASFYPNAEFYAGRCKTFPDYYLVGFKSWKVETPFGLKGQRIIFKQGSHGKNDLTGKVGVVASQCGSELKIDLGINNVWTKEKTFVTVPLTSVSPYLFEIGAMVVVKRIDEEAWLGKVIKVPDYHHQFLGVTNLLTDATLAVFEYADSSQIRLAIPCP